MCNLPPDLHVSLIFHDCGNDEQVWKNDSEMVGGKTLKNELILDFSVLVYFVQIGSRKNILKDIELFLMNADWNQINLFK